MPQIQYPFIDIAVHPAIRARFVAGEAIALFSPDMTHVLWANGEGARLFGYADIYDLLDNGPDRSSVAFRQLAATARQLENVGDRRSLMMRVNTGFASQALAAEVSLVEIRRDEIVVIFSAPVAANASFETCIAAMLKGFDDPDTHMAVIDDQGATLAASPGYAGLGVLPETARSLIAAAARSGDGLIKRPIASAAGYLPAAIGMLSLTPPLHLLFCVETVLGRMDGPQEVIEPASNPASEAPAAVEAQADDVEQEVSLPGIDEAAEQPSLIEAIEDQPETAAAPVVDDIEPVDHDIRHADELMADQAEADAISETANADEPEDHAEATRADTALNQDDSRDDIDDLASLDGASESEIEAHASAGDETPVEDAVEAGNPEPIEAASELAADQAESESNPENEQAAEPEEHVEAELAEAALNEGESEEDVRNLADLDGASPEDVDTYTPADGDTPLETEPETIDTAVPDSAVEPDAQPEAVDTAERPFEFRRDGRPVRFVWKLDAQGYFAEVSEEFARTVGPNAGDINGMSYRDLARLFNLDPDNEIGALLERRDTWSGRTIRWPVEGTDLLVPVDLAALPTYSRNREFDGFRGFGIIRVADAEQDPNAVGLTLGVEPAPAQPDLAESEAAPEVLTHEDVPLTVDDRFGNASGQQTIESDTPSVPADDFQGEVPALKVAASPLASFSEKIIQLEEHRSRSREGLTQNEQAALREIARQLEPFGKRPNDALLDTPAAPATTPVSTTLEADEPPQTVAETSPTDSSDDNAPDTPTKFEDRNATDAQTVDPEDEIPAEISDDIGLTASAADQIPLAILIHAGDRLIHANSEFKRFTGYENLEALEAAGGLDALITRHEGADAGVYMIRVDHSQLPVSARLQSVRYEGSKLLMLTLIPEEARLPAQDPVVEDHEVTRRLAALTVEAEELHSILETATDGVVVLDTDGRIRSMNRSASALFNFEDAETRGKPFVMLFAHESQKAVQDYLLGLADHGVASVLNDGRELIGREASGGFIPLFMTMGRMPGSNSYCAVIRDITQWKRSEEELKAAKRAAETANQHKSDFLARVSHEIRTPLNAIIGFSDMIASEHFGPAGHARYVEYANDIGRSGRHVLDIVNDLLDISKIEAGEMDLEFAAVGINDCVSEAVSLVQPQANAQRVIIRTSLSQSVPDVVADLRSIKQIAINILANAIRFTPSGGQIVVSTAYEPNGSVTLRIRDTGVGMSKTDLDQAMRPFGQVSPGARHRGDGTGLGLPLTRAMTEANRAMFSIQSAPNEGTLVEITFPPQRVLAD